MEASLGANMMEEDILKVKSTYTVLAATRRSALSKRFTPGTSTMRTYMNSMINIRISFPMQLI